MASLHVFGIVSLVSLACIGGAIAADPVAPAIDTESPPKNWSLSIDSDVRIVSWHGTRGAPLGFAAGTPGKGSQIYAPVSASFAFAPSNEFKLELLARSGWVSARQSSGGGLSGSISTLTDTSLTGRFTYNGWGFIQPFASLAVNLPTGRAILKGRQIFTRMDPDLVEVANYGGGRSVGPTIGVNVMLSEQTMLTLSGGHTFTQAFHRDSVLGTGFAPSRLDPADSTALNAQILHRLGDWTFSLAGLHTASGNNKLNGVIGSRSGRSFAVNGSVAYTWNDAHSTTVSSSWGLSHRTFMVDPVLGLLREPFNSNSETLRFGLDHSWAVTQDLTLGLSTSWFKRDRNAYIETDGSFSPSKTKITLGGTARYKINETFSLTARAEHYWVHEQVKPDVVIPGFGLIPGTGLPSIRSRGLLLSLGGTATF